MNENANKFIYFFIIMWCFSLNIVHNFFTAFNIHELHPDETTKTIRRNNVCGVGLNRILSEETLCVFESLLYIFCQNKIIVENQRNILKMLAS
jgi:hypothetical protein